MNNGGESDDLDYGATLRGFLPGQTMFGRYRLERILGRGGMGVVWLAHDSELELDVALKFLPDEVSRDVESMAALKRETRRGLDLAHPHIVKTYGFLKDDRAAAIAMEYVDGQTLSALKVERGERLWFEVAEIEAWVRDACAALEYAHRTAKVIHRDLKPINLMVNRQGAIKITDFGVSQVLQDSCSRVSVKGVGAGGTLLYMSPQQAVGEMPSVSDDIYSLGATIYDLLTGKAPFGGNPGTIFIQVRDRVPPSMAQRREELGHAGGPIPPAWEETVAACLGKEPGQRPQSAGEVAYRLGLARDYDAAPVVEGPKREVVRVSNLKPASPGASGRLLLVAVLLLVGAAAGWWFGVEAPKRQRAEALRQKQAVLEQKAREEKALAASREKERLEAEAKQIAEAEAARLRAEQEKARLEAERLANARGGLLVATAPAGATVMVGGEEIQQSPASFKGLKLGKYPVRISKEGYQPVSREVEIKENEFVDLGSIRLVNLTGSLKLDSPRAGTRYEVNAADGYTKSGSLPAELDDVPVGEVSVVFKSSGWPEVIQTTRIGQETPRVLTAEFAGGTVEITSEPAGATVAWEGKTLGTTPLTLKDQPPGKRTYTLSKAEHQKATVSGNVQPGETAKLVATLEKARRSLAGTWSGTCRSSADGEAPSFMPFTLKIPANEKIEGATTTNRVGDRLEWTYVSNLGKINYSFQLNPDGTGTYFMESRVHSNPSGWIRLQGQLRRQR